MIVGRRTRRRGTVGGCPASCDSRVGPGAHEMIGAEIGEEIGARNIRGESSDEHESYCMPKAEAEYRGRSSLQGMLSS